MKLRDIITKRSTYSSQFDQSFALGHVIALADHQITLHTGVSHLIIVGHVIKNS